MIVIFDDFGRFMYAILFRELGDSSVCVRGLECEVKRDHDIPTRVAWTVRRSICGLKWRLHACWLLGALWRTAESHEGHAGRMHPGKSGPIREGGSWAW